jgi:hypothetical protein
MVERQWGRLLVRRTDVCAVDEAEQVQESNCGDDEKVNLCAQASFGDWVEGDERLAISMVRSECLWKI